MPVRYVFCATALFGLTSSGCGAEPRSVCAHMEEVTRQDLGEAAAREVVDGCEFTWKMRRETKGVFTYKELADCVMDAEGVEALGKCR